MVVDFISFKRNNSCSTVYLALILPKTKKICSFSLLQIKIFCINSIHLSCEYLRNCIIAILIKSQTFSLQYANIYKTWSDLYFNQFH